jgi:hypothetical protein
MFKIALSLGIAFTIVFSTGCKKLIKVELPINKITSESVFENTSTAVSALSGVYASIGGRASRFAGNNGISIRLALMADELTPRVPSAYPEYLNNITGNAGFTIWEVTYREHIFRLNSIIEGVSNSISLPPNIRRILAAESKFTRALLYFYLVNLYGDVPLILSTSLSNNVSISRTEKSIVYEQIVADLIEARDILGVKYLDRDLNNLSNDRVRPNSYAASALLSRVYLYMEKWQEAEEEATRVIDNPDFELLSDLNKVFQKDSREAIWQLQPNPLDQDGANTPDGRFLINPRQRTPNFAVSEYILAAFEAPDNRNTNWTFLSPSELIIPYKYKEGWATFDQTEYTMVLRLAEQYLIRAEARARLNKLTGENSAQGDINAIRSRAGLDATTASSQQELLDAILRERQLELFTEWGHRWFDLKRTGKIDDVMQIVGPIKGGQWQPYKAFLPIPYDEFLYNDAIRGHQNQGYTEQP